MTNPSQNISNFQTKTSLAQDCANTCRRLLNRISRAKSALVAEFRDAMGNHQQMLAQALNEAEAIAWQTEFPQLLFPALAREKAEAAALWHRQQGRVRVTRASFAMAA